MRTSALPKEVRLRAAGIILRDRRILISRALSNPFWELPGGRVEAGEMSPRALLRELREELGVPAARLGRLVFVIENRFVHEGRRLHEVNLIYEVGLSEADWPTAEGDVEGVEPDLRFRWVELASLGGVDLRPTPLRDRLIDRLPDRIEHFEVDEWPGA